MHSLVRCVGCVLILATGASAGCGGSLAQLRAEHRVQATEVGELRAQLRAERRRPKDLENQVFLLTDRLDTAAVHGARASGPPPVLPVEVLSPDDVPENGTLLGTAEDGSEIVYVGDAGAAPLEIDADALTRRSRDVDDDGEAIETPAPRRGKPKALRALPTSRELREPVGAGAAGDPTSAGAASPQAAGGADDEGSDGALALYRRGTAALKAGDHAGAIALFRELIARFPIHEYADNAQYWLGEAFYDQKDYPRAITEFRATVTSYPRGNKVPDALLKIGLAYAALGDPAKARAALEQVLRLYPKTSPAAIAAARLEQLP